MVAALGLQLLAALRAVHAAGVVHCDVKPTNVMLVEDGRPVLVDFGIAETAGGDPAHPARRPSHDAVHALLADAYPRCRPIPAAGGVTSTLPSPRIPVGAAA